MGRFSGLAGIKTNQGGLYFLEGDYEVELDEVKMITSRKSKDCFIISGKVLTSTNAQRAPGCKPSQVITIREDILATVMGNIKQFAGAALEIENPDDYVADVDPAIPGDDPQRATDRFWEQTLEYLVSDEQPLKGMRIRLNVTQIQTKDKNAFSKHVWGPVTAQGGKAA